MTYVLIGGLSNGDEVAMIYRQRGKGQKGPKADDEKNDSFRELRESIPEIVVSEFGNPDGKAGHDHKPG